jgi:hypothetical protein
MKGGINVTTLYYYISLALTKIVDNLITTEKSILVRNNKAIAASIFVMISEFMFIFIIKKVVSDNNIVSAIVVSISAGIGSYIAFCINNRFSKEIVFINIITSNDKTKMKAFGDYMRSQGIKIVTFDAYNDDIEKTLTALVFANTREQSKKIDKYIEANNGLYREVIN